MLKKWLSKFVLDVMPSVAATIIGAYIVNHYIIPKSAPPAAATAAMAIPEARAAADVKPVPEKASFEKASFEKAVADKAAIEKTAEKAAEKTADITGALVEPRRQRQVIREKSAATDKTVGKTASIPAAVDPAPAAPPEDRHDANDLARAAIERLRGSAEAAARPVEPARVQEAARATPPAMQPLPPPIMVSTPNAEVFNSGTGAAIALPSRPVTRADEAHRLSPPADIPTSRPPLDLHAEAAPADHGSVADDMMSAAKSVFHAVLPR